MSNKPLITLQCGNYSNYLGTHFWNLQESSFTYGNDQGNSIRYNGSEETELLEVDHDVLYREGITLKKEVTYTPRLVLLDLKGSLGTLPECGELYGRNTIPKVCSESLNWTEGHQIFKEEPVKKNSFLRELDNEIHTEDDERGEKDIDKAIGIEDIKEEEEPLYNLENQVTFWSDYLAARFHPKSVLLCDSFQHKNTAHPFDTWGLGRGVWRDGRGMGDEFEDRIRFFAEECDNLGGFQLICDYQDGFGGLSASILDLIADEYSNKSLLSFPCSPAEYTSYSISEGGARLAGAVLTLQSQLEAGVVTPLSLVKDWFPLSGRSTNLPNISFNAQSDYSSSSVLALALDTATLPFRRRKGTGAMVTSDEVAQGLTTHGRKLTTLSTEVPMNMQGIDYFESGLLSKLTPLIPGFTSPIHAANEMTYTSLITVRGIKSSNIYSKRSRLFNPCPSPTSYLETCVNNSYPACRPAGSFFTKPVNTTKPFPHIFSKKVDACGLVCEDERLPNVGVNMTTVLTSWDNGNNAEVSLKSLLNKASKLSLNKIHKLGESGVEDDEWQEAKDKLADLLDCYTESDMD